MRQGDKKQGTALLSSSAASLGFTGSDDRTTSLPELRDRCVTSFLEIKILRVLNL